MTTPRPTTRRPFIHPTGVIQGQEDDSPGWKMPEDDALPVGGRATALNLVDSYPDLSSVELALLIDLYRQLSAVDIALMLSDHTIGPKLQHFAKDQKRFIKAPLRDYAFLLVFAVIGMAVTAFAIVSGKM